MVLGRKKPTATTNGNDRPPDDDGLPPPPPDDEDDAGAVLVKVVKIIPPEWRPFFSEPGKPEPGTFYPVTKKDVELGVKGIATLAFYGKREGAYPVAHNYAVCINGSVWNQWYFGVENNIAWSAEGIDAELAFEKVNEDFVRALAEGRWPERAVPGMVVENGLIVPGWKGHSLGLMWLPNAEKHQPNIGMSTLHCPIGSWPDGSSTMNPPPLILNALQGPVPWISPDRPEGGRMQ
jgi:hypothetical protein